MTTLPTSPDDPLLLHGDCLDLLATLPAESIDAFVDDPPAGIAFMGRTWDDFRTYKCRTPTGEAVQDMLFAPHVLADKAEYEGRHEKAAALRLAVLPTWAAGFVVFMAEVAAGKLRVAKPGAHSLSWALPRTSDLTMLAMRLAGWEIRDSITHLFGGGFPKSHDVSKAIDRMHGAEREVVGVKRASIQRNGTGANWEAGAFGSHSEESKRVDITAPATEDAQRWAGWGTALSPAAEYWILARAPMSGTVARNVLAHGTGALNIDATRTATSDELSGGGHASTPGERWDGSKHYRMRIGGAGEYVQPTGRWPKNAVLSCALACEGNRHSPACPRRMLDEMSGTQRDGVAVKRNGVRNDSTVSFTSSLPIGTPDQTYGGSGGASRYFPTFGYHAKASDRSIPGRSDMTNAHPTHKNPDLMRWLVRLVTPPGGMVLDCFMGSGTTGIACVAERARFVGIERDPVAEGDHDSFGVARARIMAAIGSPEAAAEANELAPVGAQLGLL